MLGYFLRLALLMFLVSTGEDALEFLVGMYGVVIGIATVRVSRCGVYYLLAGCYCQIVVVDLPRYQTSRWHISDLN